MPISAALLQIGEALAVGLGEVVSVFGRELVETTARGAGIWTKAEAWIRSGWAGKSTAVCFDKITSEEPHDNVGISAKGIMRTFEEFIRVVAQASMVLGEEIAEELYTEMLQEGFSNAIQTSLGGSFQSILNYWRGGNPLYPDDIEDVGESLSDLDIDTATLLAGMAGCNLPTTAFRLKRGVDRYVDSQLLLIRDQMRDVAVSQNDAVAWLLDRARIRAIREFDSVLSTVESAYAKAINLYDHVCERALSRIQEIKSELVTLKSWWEYSRQHPEQELIDEFTLNTTLMEDEMELDAIYNTAKSILDTVDNTLNEVDVNISDVRELIDKIHSRYLEHLNSIIEAGELSIGNIAEKYTEVMDKISAARHKTDTTTSISQPIKPEVPEEYELEVVVYEA